MEPAPPRRAAAGAAARRLGAGAGHDGERPHAHALQGGQPRDLCPRQGHARQGGRGDAALRGGSELSLRRAGRTGNATITADEGLYQSEPLRASFKGNVKVRTDDGLELESDSLKYWAKEGRLFSGDDVAFRRGVASGTATGMEYRTGEGLVLQSNVKVRLEDAAGPPDRHRVRDGHRVAASRGSSSSPTVSWPRRAGGRCGPTGCC